MGYRKQLPIRTECLNAMNRNPLSMHHNRTRRAKQIEEAYQKSMQHRINQATTPAEKRAVVVEANPLFYIFGEVRKPYKTYEEYYGIE